MEEISILLIIILICLILSAIFSATETAITSVSEAKIFNLKSDGNKNAAKLEELKKDKESLLGAILVANNTVNILASSIAAAVSIKVFGDEGVIYATIVMTISIIIFSEILPKTYALQNSEKVALQIVPFLRIVVFIFAPVTKYIRICVDLIFKIFGVDKNNKDDIESIREELRGAINLHHSQGSFKKSDKDMLGSILDLSEIDVKEIMIHRKKMYSLDIDMNIENILAEVLACGYTRIPLWKGDKENIVAVLHIKDLLKDIKKIENNINNVNILDIAAKPWFVPETTNLKNQLAEFRKKKSHCAIVIDEYGALEGMITLTDILEEIVGRIDDEHDNNNDIKLISDNIFEIDGSVTVRDLNRVAEWSLPDEEATTVSGLLIHKIEKIPSELEEFTFFGIKFTVMNKEGNQILKLKLEKLSE